MAMPGAHARQEYMHGRKCTLRSPSSRLSGLTGPTGTMFVHVAGPMGRSLDVHDCRRITDAGVELLDACRGLTCLNLARTDVSDAALTTLRMTHGHLTEIDLTGCTRVTDQGIRALVTGCQRITILRAQACRALTDVGFQAIAERPKTQSRIKVRIVEAVLGPFPSCHIFVPFSSKHVHAI